MFRLERHTYPKQKVPIVLPVFVDGVLALGGTMVVRVLGDSDVVAALKTQLDRGSYLLEGVDGPHVPTSLSKLRPRELVVVWSTRSSLRICTTTASRSQMLQRYDVP
jgi:hypothetical protein